MKASGYSTDLDLIDPDLLTSGVRKLVGIIGMVDTLTLLKARGGLPTYIPKTGRCKQLGKLLCAGSIEKLAASPLAGYYVELPKSDQIVNRLRDLYIIRVIESGEKSGRQVAAEFGITYRYVKIIKQKHSVQNPTGDLFIDNTKGQGQA